MQPQSSARPRVRIPLLLGILVACSAASATAPAEVATQLGMVRHESFPVAPDSMVDSFTIATRSNDGKSIQTGIHLVVSATKGSVSPSRVQTNGQGQASFTWRYKVPAAGVTEQIDACIAPSALASCPSGANSIGASHTGQP